jgi:hypothetical protein
MRGEGVDGPLSYLSVSLPLEACARDGRWGLVREEGGEEGDVSV